MALLRRLITLVTLLIGCAANAQQPSPQADNLLSTGQRGAPIANNDHGQAKADKGPATPGVPVLNAPQSKQDQERGGNSAKAENSIGAHNHSAPSNDEQLVNLTFWLVIATGVLMSATIMLWWETRKLASQAREASNDTKRSIEIAERSADASHRAAQAAIDAVTAERPWVLTNGFETNMARDAVIFGEVHREAFILRIKWKNFGRSPAINVNMYTDYKVTDLGAPIPKFKRPEQDELRAGSMAPGSQAVTNLIAFPIDVYNKMSNREVDIYVYSAASYKSTNNTEINFSEQCSVLSVNGHLLEENGTLSPNVGLGPIGPQNSVS